MSEGQLRGQQVVMLPEGSSRLLGRDAQRMNIAVAYAVASAVKSTLGPRGMDKMMVSDLGDIVITNDGATILKEMNVDHPAAKMLVEISKTQDEEVGDGTTSAVVLAGELLKKAMDLLDQNIHASTIVSGYKMAAQKATGYLRESCTAVSLKDKAELERIAGISMGSKTVATGPAKDILSRFVVEAITQVAEGKDNKTVDKDYIKVEKKQGKSVTDTELIRGVLVDKEIVHPSMPKRVEKAKVALVDTALEIEKTETDARISITSPDQMTAFLEQEEKMLREMVGKIAGSKCNVLFCQKGIDDVAQHYLAKEGILACRRVKKSDMEKLSRATGARVVTTLDDLSQGDLGNAGLVEERKVAGEQMVFVEKCKDPKSVTILVRGGTDHVIDEAERAVADAIGAVSSAIEEGHYVVGAGSIEMDLAMKLRKYAVEVGGREQLAVQAFAESLEVIPRTLAESCGMDPIDTLVELRNKHESPSNYGVNVYEAKIDNMAKTVIEPLKIKKQAIQSASEVAEMILRIDDVIAARGRPPSPGGGGMPGGMGGEDF
ncbi:thermosome subunit [Candidatus Micrarchaeota archaeon CG_4_10_14_0_2_um_filter_55_9]|nr:MAG: thermosome subunit [Candidatus Micrarchaeota archaeon CG1_02_55_41]PIZ92139.1 MAG: thermosome subunit [Candidatus Micrarchaeota archaeon CG_4_10_14_0_2_um_filter_55_9]PJD01505.1 MAG: thermosome subunit [Candidatus Micrarchaeota archaeon CG10_big_fil_rev_8_21_14_0_10_54_18]